MKYIAFKKRNGEYYTGRDKAGNAQFSTHGMKLWPEINNENRPMNLVGLLKRFPELLTEDCFIELVEVNPIEVREINITMGDS